MISSAPPPPMGTARFYIGRSAFYARSIAVLLALVVTARFAVSSLSHALDVSTGASDKPQPHPSAAPTLAPHALTPARQAALAPVPSVKAAADGRPLRITLSVDFGGPRAEVYVNGRKVGQIPFIGETSCRAGRPLKIEILPAKGLPLSYERECLGDSLEISTAPP